MYRLISGVLLAVALTLPHTDAVSQESRKFVRYEVNGAASYGRLEGSVIHQLTGAAYAGGTETGRLVPVAEVEFLPPSEPTKILAVGLNFASHVGSAPDAPPPMFAKFPSTLLGHERERVIPKGAGQPHYEGEMVIVIGKQARNVSESDAHNYIFGVTAGNDVSERSWQSSDLQWLRGKAADGFGPVGPAIVTGLNYRDLVVETRLNGETRQKESTKNMIHGVDRVVSWASRYFTLEPGDMIFMGTPGSTRGMKPGDVVEIEVEGVGVLRNRIVAAP